MLSDTAGFSKNTSKWKEVSEPKRSMMPLGRAGWVRAEST